MLEYNDITCFRDLEGNSCKLRMLIWIKLCFMYESWKSVFSQYSEFRNIQPMYLFSYKIAWRFTWIERGKSKTSSNGNLWFESLMVSLIQAGIQS